MSDFVKDTNVPNNDCISRQAAIDAIVNTVSKIGLHDNSEVARYGATFRQHEIIDIIEGMPSAEPQRWIPVTERLPKKSGRYIVTRGLNACDALWNRVYILNYSDLMGLNHEKIWWDGNVGKSDFTKYEDVTAWMPLSKPWKGDANDE